VQRVANRIGLVAEKNPHKTESALKDLLPSQDWSLAHHLLIHHGRQVCKARRPHCEDCRIAGLCEKRISD
ncbi:MAG: endonuclease III, partial [Syntrophomonadaceae bacterium]|nr:endonuclease III [Syntrophomonadaceae bacterium]